MSEKMDLMKMRESHERLKQWIEDRTSGGCRMLSMGHDCMCPLCMADNLCTYAEAAEAKLRECERKLDNWRRYRCEDPDNPRIKHDLIWKIMCMCSDPEVAKAIRHFEDIDAERKK